MHGSCLEDNFLCRVTTAVAVGTVHACCLLCLECIPAELSCSILYAGPRVCSVKAIITDIACIVTVEVV